MSKETRIALIEITIVLIAVPAFFTLTIWALVSSW